MGSERPSTRRYIKGEQTRDQILQAAKGLFMVRGYYNTSIYDLFEKAEITKGAFYHHWKTKEDLALTILDEMRVAYQKEVFPILQGEGPARDRIVQTLHTIRGLNVRPDWVFCRLLAMWSAELVSGDDLLGKGVRQVRQDMLDFWTQLLQRAQDEGDLRRDIPAKDMGFLVMSAILGVHIMDRNGESDASANALETLRKTLFT
jgi:TetR/AcrR family transcriptional regulator, transcriptional repressor for nem operon